MPLFMLLSSFDPNLGWEEFQVWLTGRPGGRLCAARRGVPGALEVARRQQRRKGGGPRGYGPLKP